MKLVIALLLVACGSQGQAGPAGRQGEQGLPGAAGNTGADGAAGADGADGMDLEDRSFGDGSSGALLISGPHSGDPWWYLDGRDANYTDVNISNATLVVAPGTYWRVRGSVTIADNAQVFVGYGTRSQPNGYPLPSALPGVAFSTPNQFNWGPTGTFLGQSYGGYGCHASVAAYRLPPPAFGGCGYGGGGGDGGGSFAIIAKGAIDIATKIDAAGNTGGGGLGGTGGGGGGAIVLASTQSITLRVTADLDVSGGNGDTSSGLHGAGGGGGGGLVWLGAPHITTQGTFHVQGGQPGSNAVQPSMLSNPRHSGGGGGGSVGDGGNGSAITAGNVTTAATAGTEGLVIQVERAPPPF